MKSGLEYFPLDVEIDTKLELIEAEFGLNGFALIVKLFQRIYGQQGYYCEWTQEVGLLFSQKIGLGYNFVSEIVNAAIRRGIFDKSLYEKYQILTSNGVQRRYFEAVKRRTSVEVESDYLLFCVDEKYKNVNISSKNVYKNIKNVCNFKQSRVEESRVEKSMGDIGRKDPFTPPSIFDIKSYCSERKNNIDPQRFIDFYTANGWMVGKVKMKDWKAAVRTWESNEFSKGNISMAKTDANTGFYTREMSINEMRSAFDDILDK